MVCKTILSLELYQIKIEVKNLGLGKDKNEVLTKLPNMSGFSQVYFIFRFSSTYIVYDCFCLFLNSIKCSLTKRNLATKHWRPTLNGRFRK